MFDGADVAPEPDPPAPLACVPGAIPLAQRPAHFARLDRLFGDAVRERRDVENGYAFRFDPAAFDELARFVANERRCCPFFTFTLEVAADQGPIWLRITGREGAKAVLQSALLA